MNNFKRSLLLSLIIAAVLLLATACGGGNSTEEEAEATYTFKIAHIAPPDHSFNDAAEKFKEELEVRSEGRMTLQIYPAGQLGNEADMVQQIESGSVDFGIITAAYLSSRAVAFSAWFAPYLFDDYIDVNEARKTDVSKKMLATLDEQGITGLDYHFSGHRVMLFKDKKAMTPQDMQGLKLRVTPSPTLQDWYKSLGISPESLSLPDVYQAVQTGVIDGMDMDLDVTINNKYYEVVKYAAVTNHMVWPGVAITNKSKLEKMPVKDQEIVLSAISAAVESATLKRAGQEEEFKQILTDAGLELYEIDQSVFKQQIDEFDQKYGAMDPLILEFINTFR